MNEWRPVEDVLQHDDTVTQNCEPPIAAPSLESVMCTWWLWTDCCWHVDGGTDWNGCKWWRISCVFWILTLWCPVWTRPLKYSHNQPSMRRVLIGPISRGAASVVTESQKAKWCWACSISATSRSSAALSQTGQEDLQGQHPYTCWERFPHGWRWSSDEEEEAWSVHHRWEEEIIPKNKTTTFFTTCMLLHPAMLTGEQSEFRRERG